MGRQINFYVSKQVQNAFFDFLQQNHFTFLDVNAEEIKEPQRNDIFMMYLFKQSYGTVLMHTDVSKRVDVWKSPVIEFCKSHIEEKEKKVYRGRLWVANRYYDEAGNIVEKDIEFMKDYQRLVRWIKKNVPYKEIEGYGKAYISDEIMELYNQKFKLTL